MSVSMTVRDVPQHVRDTLAARAARSGQSLQEYLRAKLIADASSPTVEEVLVRARRRVELTGTQIAAHDIVGHRDADRR